MICTLGSRPGLERSKECGLFFECLESTVTELRGCVDELEVDLLQISATRVDHERFTDRDNTLLGSGYRALEQQEVVLDDTVVGETTHGGDGLLGGINLGRGV